MNIRLIGALVLCLGSSYLGFSAAGTVKKTGKTLQNLKRSLEMMRCEVSYTLTPIVRICEIICQSSEGEVRQLYQKLIEIYSGPYPSQESWADILVRTTLRSTQEEVCAAMSELIASFGRFGANEQLRLIDLTLEKVDTALQTLNAEKKQRCKCYETLGICTGIAFAVLVL